MEKRKQNEYQVISQFGAKMIQTLKKKEKVGRVYALTRKLRYMITDSIV